MGSKLGLRTGEKLRICSGFRVRCTCRGRLLENAAPSREVLRGAVGRHGGMRAGKVYGVATGCGWVASNPRDGYLGSKEAS